MRLFTGILLLFFVNLHFPAIAYKTVVQNLRCEYRNNPLGVDEPAPRLSWEILSEKRNVLQTAYRIVVSDNLQSIKKNIGNVWDSKKVASSSSIQINYPGTHLESARKYFWKVMVWDNGDQASEWSSAAYWQMGLLTEADWKGARWIAYEDLPVNRRITPYNRNKENTEKPNPRNALPLLRKEFTVTKKIKQATAFICGLGQFEMSLNGKKVDDHFLDPGWTDYAKQALYVTFDVTKEIKPGRNVIGVMLGNGFLHIPNQRFKRIINSYGYPKMICLLRLGYSDGTKETVISDSTWRTAPGPLTYSSIYGGEDYNATLEQPGWDAPGFMENASWRNAIIVDGPPELHSQMATPVKIKQSFDPVKITCPSANCRVYDLGQNASGIVRITVKGNKGDSIKLSPGELLDEKGFVTQVHTGGPYNFIYILKGGGPETWQPRFTYYGFRYVQMEGGISVEDTNTGKKPLVLSLQGLHTTNSAERIGNFSCSGELFNKTERLIDWAIRSNMMSLFTDCPHREKFGWLEEDHLMGNSIHYQYDIASLSAKVIQDMRASQTSEGLVPEIAPEYTVFTDEFRDSPEWGSNCIIFPWYLYHWYGDKKLLSDSYPMMQKYVQYLETCDVDNILMQGLSDWYDLGPDKPGYTQLTPNGITATAIFYYDLCIMAKIAALLDRPGDVITYEQSASKVKEAFNKTFFNKDTKQYSSGSQASNAMALYMELVGPEDREAVLDNLLKDIRGRNNSFTAGDIGYRYLLEVLKNEGRSDVIFDMNCRSDVPGYGYQIARGATALTESWQALPVASNNHFMLGHLLEWFYSGLVGISNAGESIAYKLTEIRPEPVGDITAARADFRSPYGLITADWKREDQEFNLDVSIPANSSARIYLPAKETDRIFEGGIEAASRKDMKFAGIEKGRAIVNVGSGRYHFVVKNSN